MFLAFSSIAMLLSNPVENMDANYFGYLLCLFCAQGQGGMGILNRMLSELDWSVLMFVYSIVGLIFSAGFIVITGAFTMHSFKLYVLLALLCSFDFGKTSV
jgi:drug/metabolite transporter (DMT)-like permease